MSNANEWSEGPIIHIKKRPEPELPNLDGVDNSSSIALAQKIKNLIENATVCKSCGVVFDGLNHPHTDDTCYLAHADWETANRNQIAYAVSRLLT